MLMHYTQAGNDGPFIIYKITDRINDKPYFGLTTTTIENRWKDYIHGFKRGRRAINIAMRTLGIENFTIEAFASCLTLKDLRAAEMIVIRQENSLVPNGYNMVNGGAYKARDFKFSEETLKIIRDKAIAYANTPEGKEIKRTWLGKRHSEKSRKLMSERQKGHLVSDKTKQNLSIADRKS